MLSEDAKKVYLADCNISDANTKMLDLMRNFKQFDIQMEGNIHFYIRHPFLYWLFSNDNFKFYTLFVWYCSFAINIFMAFTVQRVNGDLKPTQEIYNTILKVACWILSGVSFICLVCWFFFQYRQVVQISTEDFKFDNPGRNPNSISSLFEILLIKSFFVKPTPLNMLLHTIFCGLGGTFSYYLISLNLLLVVNISRTAKFVLTATFLHFDQLVLTLVLTVFVIYSYSLVIAENYYGSLDYGGDDDLDLCKDLKTCFFFIINWGLRNGGGIADSMQVVKPTDKFYPKSLFEVSFFMVVNVIALNIIFGIIIDTFSQLRDEEHERDIDKRNHCFVCGKLRSDFAKKNLDFQHHILNEHDPWNYVYFIYYLKNKGEDDLNGLEYFTWRNYQENNTSWVPIGDTLYLSNEENDLEDVEERINSLNSTLSQMDTKIGNDISTLKSVLKHLYKRIQND